MLRPENRGMNAMPGIPGWFGASLRVLGAHQDAQQTSLERLTTGQRINRGADDPSGMMAAENFRGRQEQITRKIDAFAHEDARLGATEGGLSVLQDMLIELSGLVVQGANRSGLSQAETDAIGVQIDSVVDGINHIAQTTMFDGRQILLGYDAASLGSVMTEDGPVTLNGLSTLLTTDPEAAQSLVKAAEEFIADDRAAIGTRMKQIDTETAVLREEFAANAGALSQIADTDYAREASELVRTQILEQATVKAILIERENAERVLDLLTPVAGPGKRA